MKHSHYYKDVTSLQFIDVYKVCDLFQIQDASGALQHAIKKLLCAGQRGTKDKFRDVQEAVDTLNRFLEFTEQELLAQAVEMEERRNKYIEWLKEQAEFNGEGSTESARQKAKQLISEIESKDFDVIENPFSEKNWPLG